MKFEILKIKIIEHQIKDIILIDFKGPSPIPSLNKNAIPFMRIEVEKGNGTNFVKEMFGVYPSIFYPLKKK